MRKNQSLRRFVNREANLSNFCSVRALLQWSEQHDRKFFLMMFPKIQGVCYPCRHCPDMFLCHDRRGAGVHCGMGLKPPDYRAYIAGTRANENPLVFNTFADRLTELSHEFILTHGGEKFRTYLKGEK